MTAAGIKMLKRLFGFSAMALALTACVTINIYFPAAAAEEAARTIVRDVLKSEQNEPETPVPGDEKQSSLDRDSVLLVALGRVLEVLVPSAHAAQADIDINTAAIRGIRASMEKRQARLAPFYRSGAIGFDNRGAVAIRDLNAVSLGERNQLKKLVTDENADRSRLYREIAKANGHPEWEGEVRQTFAKVWVQEAPPGYWYQAAGGQWQQR